MLAMAKMHEGVRIAHQDGIKMKWLLRHHGYFWLNMTNECIDYAKGCEACPKHDPIQHVPALVLKLIIKPWLFRRWTMDIIGKIHSPSSKTHSFILDATDYFINWIE